MCFIVVFFVVASGFAYWAFRPSEPVAVAPAAPRGVPLYDFEFDATTTAPQGLGPTASMLSGRTRLKGQFSLETSGSTRELRLVRLDEIELKVGEKTKTEAAVLRAALEGHRARWQFSDGDRLQGVTVDVGAPPLFENLALTLTGELQLERRSEATWSTTERTGRGVADVDYSRDGKRVTKTRRTYSELTGLGAATRLDSLASKATFELDDEDVGGRAGVTGSVGAGGAERQTATRGGGLPVHRRDTTAIAEPVAGFTETSRLPGQPVQPTDAAQQHLAQRINGLTATELTDGILRLAALGDSPDRLQFAIRATGLLRAQPELAVPLGERAALAKDSAQRGFVLDLLAGAGTPEAQAAMRATVVSPLALADRERVTQFARLALVEHPTPETVAFVEDAWQRAEGKDKRDRALVVGAVAAAMKTDGELARAEALGQQLAAALASAKEERDTLALVRALGNAGLDSQARHVIRETTSPSVTVRSVAAFALRKIEAQEARRTLLSLTEDPAIEVQRSAFHGLGKLSVAEAEELSARSARISATTELISALAPFASRLPVRDAFTELAKRPGLEPQARERIRTMLEEAR